MRKIFVAVFSTLLAGIMYPGAVVASAQVCIEQGEVKKTEGLEWVPNVLYATGLMLVNAPRAYKNLIISLF